MFKIKQDSWHYKLLAFFGGDYVRSLSYGYSSTLCKYFWMVVGHILISLLVIMLGIAALALIISVVVGIVQFFTFIVSGAVFAPVLLETAMTILAVGTVVSIMVAPVGLIWFLLDDNFKLFPDYMKRWWSSAFPKSDKATVEKVKEEKAPSLIVEYYKAHKEKWCPMVVVEDGE